ncbi:hypothetical protein AGR7C_Cc180007 [Agrobacterium deltaense Zutra 3/1]|uniref:Uncharacterized protein n=1 Tax=Agrobacterium deltaense Zutra 3/1 TaxID=1183427 RepID=A0A1S7PSN8_9HYPH|nr:hypothetical protein AGR7C_Cc180007 [Agrobacterium deltaense Zutra 3/1]
MHRHPVAGSAQRFGQFRFRHVAGEIGAQRSGSFRSADRGDVEPFMGGDQVHLAAPAGRIDQAEIAKSVGAGFATGSHFDIANFKACHCFNPCPSACFIIRLLVEAIVRTCRLLRLFCPFARQVFPALLMSSLCHGAFNGRLKGMINGPQTNYKRLVKLGFR